ncbi:MAG: hypothetical protein ACWGQW_00405 [bacterium]
MIIVDAYWTAWVNVLVMECECGYDFAHRADRWKVKCPKCGATDNLQRMREDDGAFSLR